MISIIIPVFDAERTLGLCLDSLENQSFPRDKYEIIVVDDGSSDSTARVAEKHDVIVARQARSGPGAARNHGVRLSRGETLLFTDADCVPALDWIERMLDGFCEPDVVGVKGAYGTRQRGLVARFIQQEFEEKYDRIRGVNRIDFVDAYSAAYRRDTFLQAGGFDERFRLAEDVELSYRLASLGCRMVFQPSAIVYHLHTDTAFDYARKKFLSAYWRSRAYRRFPAKTLRDSTTPGVLYLQMPMSMALLATIVVRGLWTETTSGALLIGAAFLASAVPFVKKAWGRDRAAAAAAPLLLLTRALALSAGLATGVVSQLWARFYIRREPPR